MSYLFYDCEIINLIPDRKIPNDPNYTYCKGWGDYAHMGISVLGFHSSFDRLAYLAGEDIVNPDPKIDFNAYIKSHDFVIGFNSKSFDDKLCICNGIQIKTHYDLLDQIRLAAFGTTAWQGTPGGYTYTLGAIAAANGMAKTGSGELAPKLWQDGKKQEVINYCLNDVQLEFDIFNLGINGLLIDPNNQKLLTIPTPENL